MIWIILRLGLVICPVDRRLKSLADASQCNGGVLLSNHAGGERSFEFVGEGYEQLKGGEGDRI